MGFWKGWITPSWCGTRSVCHSIRCITFINSYLEFVKIQLVRYLFDFMRYKLIKELRILVYLVDGVGLTSNSNSEMAHEIRRLFNSGIFVVCIYLNTIINDFQNTLITFLE